MRWHGQPKGLDNTCSTTLIGSLQDRTQSSIFLRSLHCLEGSQDGKFYYQNLTSFTCLRRPSKDFLVERANEEYEPMSFDFLDEDLMAVLQIEEEESPEEDVWKMYFDGASNALGRGVGVVLISF